MILCIIEFCSYDKFKCENGKCVYDVYVCDGGDHCGDNSDEERNCDDHGKCCLIRYESSLGFSIDRL